MRSRAASGQAIDQLGDVAAPGADAFGGFALDALRVRDERGTALETLPPPAVERGVADPVAALLAPPRKPLMPGEQVTVVLFGRAPQGQAWLEGLGAEPIPLVASELPPESLDGVLARLERDGSPAERER